MRSSYHKILVIVMFLLSLAAAGLVLAGGDDRSLYQWTDDQGNVGLTDDLGKVPQQYRSRATRLQQPGASEPGKDRPQMQQQAVSEERQDGGAAADADDLKKAEWQQRMHDAKRRLEAAEKRIGELEQRKKDIASQWGASGAALAPQNVLDEVDRINADIERARRDVEIAKEQVQVTIPDEARKAGIPPGWLREVP
jgi:hypothetical protein